MDRRSFAKTAVTAGVSPVVVSLSGCLGEDDDEMTSELAITFYPTAASLIAFVVAIEKGLLEEEGLIVEDVVSFSGGGDTARGITTGGIGLGGSSVNALIAAYMSGAAIQMIGLYMSSPTMDFLTLPNSDVEDIRDLDGRSVAIGQAASTDEAALLASLEQADGISIDDVDIVEAGGLGEAETQLREGEVDVAFSLPPRSTMLVEENEVRSVFKAREYASNLCEYTLGASTDALNENPKMVNAYVRGMINAYEYVAENPEESAETWAELAEIPEEIAEKSIQDIAPEETLEIRLEEEPLKSTAEMAIRQGIIDEQPPWDEILNQESIPEEHQVDWL